MDGSSLVKYSPVASSSHEFVAEERLHRILDEPVSAGSKDGIVAGLQPAALLTGRPSCLEGLHCQGAACADLDELTGASFELLRKRVLLA